MKLYIKNMVCNRCITSVIQLLDELKINYSSIHLGEVILSIKPTEKQHALLKSRLSQTGFELLDDSKNKLIEKIKTTIIEHVHYGIGR